MTPKRRAINLSCFFIIKLSSIIKNTPYIALYFTAFQNNCCLIISKKDAWLPPVFFSDFNSP